MNIENAAMMAYLKASHAFYHGKALELREVIEEWLSYVPNSFPHYTRHTVRHSDEIIIQMSSLLFGDDDPITPAISLSAVEVYILIAAAYLHDAGMVASDREKAEILKSDEWRFWALEGGGAARWRELEVFRYGVQPANEDLRNFLADVQVRFLISEFIRRTHHIRSAEVITQYQAQLARCAFDDPLLQRTISDICVAHGLRGYELDDRERFPHQRDIRGEKVNVRLLAILLRLGDLLDMSSDRACPLLLNAACPLPAESLAHWTQYQRITHRNTSPARIEITAECYNGEEHRVLQDWCQWIVDETRNASILMAHSPRHADWKAPEVAISGDSATIIVRPHQDAKYIPSRWIFTVDQDAILTRLIDDVYDTPAIFIRELTQNALDTTRCQMYVDLAREGFEAPEFPT